MTTEIFFSSNRLGDVTDRQLQLMINRFGLGRLLSAAKTSKGVGNQTMFVRSTGGEFVLKGNPLYAGQFREEQFYVENLLERTGLPVPSPYLVDEATGIFGWPYALMPRLPGKHVNDPAIMAGLRPEGKQQMAALLATSLRQLHSWKVDRTGEFDPVSGGIRPFPGSYRAWLYGRIRYWLNDARRYSAITPDDVQWVEGLLATAADAFDRLSTPSYVMGDFKAENILVINDQDGNWRLSGIIDFTSGHFGDGLADLPKPVIMYLDAGESELARRFVRDYRDGLAAKDGFRERLQVHLLMQLVLHWGCAKATQTVTWDDGLSFAHWARAYTQPVVDCLDCRSIEA